MISLTILKFSKFFDLFTFSENRKKTRGISSILLTFKGKSLTWKDRRCRLQAMGCADSKCQTTGREISEGLHRNLGGARRNDIRSSAIRSQQEMVRNCAKNSTSPWQTAKLYTYDAYIHLHRWLTNTVLPRRSVAAERSEEERS